MRKAVLIPGVIAAVLVAISLLMTAVIMIFGLNLISQFSQAAQESPLVLAYRFRQYESAINPNLSKPTTLLLLGVDTLQSRGDQPPLTDSMMLIKIWPAQATISTLALPRDLYSPISREKINSLYASAREKNKKDPTINVKNAVATEISTLTGIPIDQSMIFTLEDVSAFVDSIGGLPVEVETAFVDELFPNPTVDTTLVKDPKLLYQTVRFDQGLQIMNGARVLEYIRSRHSNDSEGNDLARNKRQQQVLVAIMNKLTDQTTVGSPTTLGKLYRLYHQRFESQLPPADILNLVISMMKTGQLPQLKRGVINVYPEDSSGVIFHPPERQYGGAWVFAIKDETLFKQEVKSQLQP